MKYYIQTVAWNDGKLLEGRSAGDCSGAMKAKKALKALHQIMQLLRRFGEKEGSNQNIEFILTLHPETWIIDCFNGEVLNVPEIEAIVQTVRWVTPLRAARLLEATRLIVSNHEYGVE